jgi:hypothetical protein
MHLLSKYGWRFQTDNSDEVVTFALRYVDPGGFPSQQYISRTGSGCGEGPQDSLETGMSNLKQVILNTD